MKTKVYRGHCELTIFRDSTDRTSA